jgi:hypothetical protein
LGECLVFDLGQSAEASLPLAVVVCSLDPRDDGQSELFSGGPRLLVQDGARPLFLLRSRLLQQPDEGLHPAPPTTDPNVIDVAGHLTTVSRYTAVRHWSCSDGKARHGLDRTLIDIVR